MKELKPIGVQLYSLRQAASQDFVKVLKRVADIGYVNVEPAGFWNMRPSVFKKVIDDLGLKIISSHTPWAHEPKELGQLMDIADILGLKNMVCGYRGDDFKDMDSIKRTADNTRAMMEILQRNGFQLFQHNHDFEFQRLDGRIKYDIYRELVGPGLKFEIDCFWSTSLGKEDPVEMLKMFAKDTILLHMKDGHAEQRVVGNDMVNGILERHVELMPLGTGELPIPALIEAAPEQVESVIVELDSCIIDMDTAIEQSYHYLVDNHLAKGNK
ncbi:MAG: sugar phosphate isomerase/epimerase [Victivallales bacterium]|nr:sugar phosphate isomerase/epimerase [Victivallales bacterium]